MAKALTALATSVDGFMAGLDENTEWPLDLGARVPRQATFALSSNEVRSRAFWGPPLPSSTVLVV
jgi:hypothetical protein